jgi:group I intron endonuclease
VYKTINLVNQKYYIGKHSSEDPNDKYLGSGKALQRAIKKHGLENFKKEVLHLYESEVEAYNKEREILEELDGVKDPLCYNLCYGGVGFWKGATHSAEVRDKISEGNKGKVRTDDAKQKYSTTKKGIPKSEIHKQRLSEVNLGKTIDEDTKKKISESNMGRIQTAETREKISRAHIGRPSIRKGTECSEETKQKMSAAQKGRIVTEEAKEKLREYIGDKNSQFGSMWITDGNTNMKIKKDVIIPEGWGKGRTFKEGYNHVRD